MKKSLIAFVALGLVSGLSLAATAEEEEGASRVDAADAPASKIYRTTDEKGNVVFTDQPGENSRSEEVKLKTTNTVPIKKVEMPEAVSAQLAAEEESPVLLLHSPAQVPHEQRLRGYYPANVVCGDPQHWATEDSRREVVRTWQFRRPSHLFW